MLCLVISKRQCISGCCFWQVDVDIGSSAVANGVLGLVFGVVTTLVVDMAFLIQVGGPFSTWDFFYMTLMFFFSSLLRLRMQSNLVKDSSLLDSRWDKKMLPSLWENRRLVGQCMWGSHFWLFICYYSYLQANTYEELPEQVIGAARLAHVEPSTAVVPNLENNSESNKDNSSNDATSSEDDSSKKTNWFSLFCEEFDEIFCFYPFKLCY